MHSKLAQMECSPLKQPALVISQVSEGQDSRRPGWGFWPGVHHRLRSRLLQGQSPLVCLGCRSGRGVGSASGGFTGLRQGTVPPHRASPPGCSGQAFPRSSDLRETEQPRDGSQSVCLITHSLTSAVVLWFTLATLWRREQYLRGPGFFTFVPHEKAPRSVPAPEPGCGTPRLPRPLRNVSFVEAGLAGCSPEPSHARCVLYRQSGFSP